ncbi:MAG: MMPL family transporter [Piscirickettsiaceae bacterium]|nr:MMPL family transporter [Piscirickettsiaceae bacterium]
MRHWLALFYERHLLAKPVRSLFFILLLTAISSWYIQDFKLDISADSLVLESDKDLNYHRSINARYGSDDYLIVTYTPKTDLFDRQSLDDIAVLRNSLAEVERVESVISILDVPLIASPAMTFRQLQQHTRLLRDVDTDLELAKKELRESPLYRNRLVGQDGNTTALQVNFERDQTYIDLRNQRDALREKELEFDLSPVELLELERLGREFKHTSSALMAQEARNIASIRTILDRHRDVAEIHLGGVPMVVADMMDFVRHDLRVFSVAVVGILIGVLAVIFGRLRWVVLPLLLASVASVMTIGLLGFLEWRITVVSSNFLALLLIFTLSLTIHLIVRYRELQVLQPQADQFTLLKDTVRSKVIPCLYTVITTMVAFGSLVVSGIRPVIDFGWIMVIGLSIAFILTFTLFPVILMLMKPIHLSPKRDLTGVITGFFADLNARFGNTILLLTFVAMVLGGVGISRLSVENRFIDYFKASTEIFQGMYLIDQKLGGTTPLNIIIDAPADFLIGDQVFEALEDEDFELELEGEQGFSASSYWFNSYQLETIKAVHHYLDELPETGKVLSLATSMDVLKQLNEGEVMDDFFMSILYKRLPEEIKQTMIRPYLSEDGNQLRFSVRVFESDAGLKRQALLAKIETGLTEQLGLEEDQVHLTGMLVLFNNMLQSLYRSQILTLGVVFFAIFLMFTLLFRSLKLALIAIVPNLVAGVSVLGLMGVAGIPLDMMTITITAISVGIAVDNTIHYMHRLQSEVAKDWDYPAALRRSHGSIGRAMYYTTITIMIGFSILALSDFVPTIYFGVLTAFAMFAALLADLTVLPILLGKLKPYGKQAPIKN